MDPHAEADAVGPRDRHAPPPGVSSGHLRGSGLLLLGRVIALGLNFAVQILIVRHLTKADFGAFAYALSIATIGEGLTLVGLDRAVARYLPIYDEQGDQGRVLGLLALAIGTVAAAGLAMIVVVLGLRGLIAGEFADDPTAVTVLVIMVTLAPLLALDRLTVTLFAAYGRPGAIFMRKYVAAPGLRLLVVLALVLGDADVVFLATGYVIAGVAGVALFLGLLIRVLHERGVLHRGAWARRRYPTREAFAFAIPLLSTDLVFAAMNQADAIMLGHLGGATDVAALRAIYPAARLNQLVLTSFGMLFTPMASRLFSRGDHSGVNALYWRTATWIAVVSFPVFAVTTALAGPLTTFLFGARYADSAPLLAILALGYYVHAVLGFNGLTLNVYRRVRYIVTVDVAALVVNVLANLALIPRMGASGAAVATAVSLTLHNVLKQVGLRRCAGLHAFDRHVARPYAVITVGALVVLAVVVVTPPLGVTLPLLVATSLLVVWLNREALQLEETFPALARHPGLRKLLGGGGRS